MVKTMAKKTSGYAGRLVSALPQRQALIVKNFTSEVFHCGPRKVDCDFPEARSFPSGCGCNPGAGRASESAIGKFSVDGA
jgi:hypothetical protein